MNVMNITIHVAQSKCICLITELFMDTCAEWKKYEHTKKKQYHDQVLFDLNNRGNS